MDVYVGTICAFGFNFAPYQWAQCNGQLLPISQYTVLFSLIGTYYGGNGTTNFALPNLVGHVANGQGQLPGGNNYVIGETGGNSTVTLTNANLPAHVHPMSFALNCNNTAGSAAVPNPVGAIPATGSAAIYNPANSNVALAAPTITLANTGSSSPSPVSIVDPCLVMNYNIALNGIYPQRG